MITPQSNRPQEKTPQPSRSQPSTPQPSTSQGVYTHGHHESVLRSHRWRTAQNSAGYLLPWLRPGMSLLDVGCGPGTITADLAVLLAPGRVLGIDPAPDVVELAREAISDRALGNVAVAVGDVYALDSGALNQGVGDSAPERFDVVHAHQVLQHLPDPVGALRAMGRRCRPGGLVAARDSDYSAFTWYPQLPELTEWLALYQRAARANGGEPDAGRRLLGWAQAAGLAEVVPTASAWCFATSDDRAWWGGMWADRILESAMARQVVDTHVATPADLRRISAGWLRWAQADDGWMAILHGEIVCRVPG